MFPLAAAGFLAYIIVRSVEGLGGWSGRDLVSLYVMLGIGVAIMLYVRFWGGSDYFSLPERPTSPTPNLSRPRQPTGTQRHPDLPGSRDDDRRVASLRSSSSVPGDGQVSWTAAWPVDPAITGRIETGWWWCGSGRADGTAWWGLAALASGRTAHLVERGRMVSLGRLVP